METRSLPTEFGFAWSCNCAGPNWEQPDTVTITGPAADSLKNTSVGFASGQPSLSSSNTVAVDPEAGQGGRGGSGYSCNDLLLYIPRGAFTTTTRSASWHITIEEGVTSIVKGESKGGKPSSRANLAKLLRQFLM